MTDQPVRVDTPIADMDHEQRSELLTRLQAEHAAHRAKDLGLDLTRGKPSPEQLDLALPMLALPGVHRWTDVEGTDVRNYGGLTGLPAMRALFADLMNVAPGQVVAQGNSSLELMHETVANGALFGFVDDQPFRRQARQAGRPVQFICPVPGYDRHFDLTHHLGIAMMPVEMGEAGPDLDLVARIASDPLTKGMWVVPMYSNPTGINYTEDVVRRLLTMEAAPDFRILWDNAYAVHHLTDDEPRPLPILEMAAEAGNPDRVIAFASTSKISFAGAGVAALASSEANIEWWKSHSRFRRIGPDKVNQLRHLEFFGDADGVRHHMAKHRAILKPRFDVVHEVLTDRLTASQVASWTHPAGGYFVSLDVKDGTAQRVVNLAKEAGVALTPAGSAHPRGKDPHDRTIRLAPSMPSLEDVRAAMEVVATSVLLAAIGG